MICPKTSSLENCRVLIIEDEYFLGDDLAKALRSLGIQAIGPIGELPEALSIEHDGFDLAVIDINLHGHSAYPIADVLTRVGKPFLFTTGYGAETVPRRFRHVTRWEKPYDIRDVLAAVIELCGRKQETCVAV